MDISKKLKYFFMKTELPAEVKNYKGKLLLHIGDVTYDAFPYIMRLIRQLRPDILVHTGDMVDNLKVSRIPEDVPPYKKQTPKLIRCMEKYAKEVYIVPGNNDLEDFLEETVTKAKIIQPNTCMDIGGIPFLLCHRVMDIDGEAKIYLYGHGPTGDNHSYQEGEKYYSNVFFQPSVVLMEEARCVPLKDFRIRKPKN